jgi:arabinogalactan oligomer/maltooligosaccharide transport system permease protein
MNRAPPSHRRRFLLGFTLAALFGAVAIHLALSLTRSSERESVARRGAVVKLQGLAQALDRAGVAGGPARAVVARWSESERAARSVRVIALQGISLEASTAPEDRGAQAAPRHLARDEKPLYDRGQRLRAAVETNRQEGAPRKPEIEIEPLPDGMLALAVPLERDGAVVGAVSIEAPAAASQRGAPPLSPALAVALAVALFWLASRWIGERRGVLAAVAALLLAASIGALGYRAVQTLARDRRAAEIEIADQAQRESAQAAEIVAAAAPGERAGPSAAAPITATGLNVDLYRRPVAEEGRERITPGAVPLTSAAAPLLAAVLIFAAAILAFVGFGWSARLAATLRRHRQAYLYVLPAMLGMLVLVFFPFIYGVILSFTDSTLFNTDKSIPEIWIGLHNYAEILGDFSIVKNTAAGLFVNYLNFYWTLFNTVLWTVTNVSIGVSVGLLLALILNTRSLALRPVYRVLLILPWAMPNYITSLIWRGMFHRQFGVINQVIQIFGGQPLSWFDRWSTSFATALATNGWLSFPFMMVVSLGALQSIPNELYEASRMDGASRWQQFRAITLPSLKPALIPAIILSVIWTFNMFNIIYLVTQGEPGSSTEILITQSYKFAFERYRYGYAAAYSTVIFMILLIYGWWQNRVTGATEGMA